MLSRLATFLFAHGRRVLFGAVIGVVVAGVFGFGVARHLSPYGANDPSTQSVQATNRYQAVAGRQIEAGVVALVTSGEVRSQAARQRVGQIAERLRAQPDVARVVTSVFALNLVTGLGLGLAIDYSLFMVSRYREEAGQSGFGLTALRRTLETAGRTILFSSITVAAAIAALAIFPQRFLYSMGIAGALVAVIAAALALSVLPALLAVLGPRVNALAPKRLQRAGDRDARPEASGVWYRLSQFVMRRPGRIAALSAGALIALGIPFASIKFLPVHASVLPASASAHRVDQTLRNQFPPGRTTPLEVVVAAPARSPQVSALAQRIRALPGVSAVAPSQPGGRDIALLDVAPSAPTYSAAAKRLVHAVRALRAPFYVGVAGQTAGFIDLEHS